MFDAASILKWIVDLLIRTASALVLLPIPVVVSFLLFFGAIVFSPVAVIEYFGLVWLAEQYRWAFSTLFLFFSIVSGVRFATWMIGKGAQHSIARKERDKKIARFMALTQEEWIYIKPFVIEGKTVSYCRSRDPIVLDLKRKGIVRYNWFDNSTMLGSPYYLSDSARETFRKHPEVLPDTWS